MKHRHLTSATMLGIGWMLLHCLCGALFSGLGRIMAERYSVFQLSFFQSSIGCLCVLLWLGGSPLKYRPKTGQWLLHISRALSGFTATCLWFISLRIIPLAEATAIGFIAPIFASVMAVLFIGEKLSLHRAIALIAGFVGMLIIIRPGTEAFSPFSILVVVVSILWALCDIIIKILSRTESVKSQALYITFLSTLLSLPFTIMFWKTPTLLDFGYFIVLGFLFFMLVTTIFMALSKGDLTLILPFSYAVLVFMTAIGYFGFGEVPDHFTIIGAVVIAASACYLTLQEKRSMKELKSDALDFHA